jgi:hypothetical protein
MWAVIGQYVGGKVLTAILVVGSGAAMIWFWRHPESLQAIWSVLKGALAWMGFAIVFPWAMFMVTAKVVKTESNTAAGVMLGGYLAADALVAFWLAGWSIDGALTWVVVILGFLAAGVYNFLVCDHIAERVGDSL